MNGNVYMFGDKFTFGSSYVEWPKHAQKSHQAKTIFFYIKQGSIAHSFDVKQFFILHSLYKSALFLRQSGNETYTFYHLYTLFNLKKLKHFLNITE